MAEEESGYDNFGEENENSGQIITSNVNGDDEPQNEEHDPENHEDDDNTDSKNEVIEEFSQDRTVETTIESKAGDENELLSDTTPTLSPFRMQSLISVLPPSSDVDTTDSTCELRTDREEESELESKIDDENELPSVTPTPSPFRVQSLRSALPPAEHKSGSPFAPHSLIDVPDYGFAGLDGSFQAPF